MPCLDADVISLLPGGESLVHTAQGAVLVPHAIPGEQVHIEITGKRRGVLRGMLVDIIRPAETRITPVCPVAHACGGCALQHIAPQMHANIKSAWVHDAFAGLITKSTAWRPCQSGSGLRRRVRWVVGHDEQGTFLGFYAHASHQPVRHDHCMVTEPGLNHVRQQLEPCLPDAVTSVQGICLHNGIHIILEAEAAAPARPDLPHIEHVQWWWRHGHLLKPLTRPVLKLEDSLPAGEQEVAIRIGPNDFIQGDKEGNRAMVRQVQQWLPADCRLIVDLFCGAGNLSLPAAVLSGARVHGAEGNADSVRLAGQNAKRLRVDARFETLNLFEGFRHENYIAADVLILDPPRKGARRICSNMHVLMPERIIMISCDVAAGARDAHILAEQGYRLTALRSMDMFPFAGHVETMSLWQR